MSGTKNKTNDQGGGNTRDAWRNGVRICGRGLGERSRNATTTQVTTLRSNRRGLRMPRHRLHGARWNGALRLPRQHRRR